MSIANFQKELRDDLEKHGFVERPSNANFNDDTLILSSSRVLGKSNVSTYNRFDASPALGGKLQKNYLATNYFNGRDHYDAGSPTDISDIAKYRTRNSNIVIEQGDLDLSTSEGQADNQKLQEEFDNNLSIITEIEARLDIDDFIADPDGASTDNFNPDFSADTIGFSYYFGGFNPPSERGANQDGVTTGSRTPNLKYPNSESSATPVFGQNSNSQFGTSASEMPSVATNVDTYKILKKYT